MSRTTSETHRGPIAWMAGHSVAANLVMFLCLVGGYLSLRRIKQEVFPDFQLDRVAVTVAYPGASPEEVEQGVILPIEEAVEDLDEVKEVTSVAQEGVGTVTIEFVAGTDLERAAQDVKSEVDRITTFPEDAEEPLVRVVSRRREVLDLVLYGRVGPRILHELAERVRDHLLQSPGITQVEVRGLPPLEISVEVSREDLRRYGLTTGELADRIRCASLDLPGGGVKTPAGEVLLRVKERRETGRQFAHLPVITTPGGTSVALGSIARVEDGFADVDRYLTYNGLPAVVLEVYRVGDQSPIEVSEAVRSEMGAVRAMLPPGVSTAIERDRSGIYRDRIRLLLKNGSMGLVLVLTLLGLFLEARLAFWVMMGIPVSFLGSFLLLPTLGVSINMVSLFAYIIAVGIVVDDAIVVGENVYRYRQEGVPFLAAAVRGAREVAMPVTFSVLTNVVAFLPLMFVPGPVGKIFKVIPLVVGTVFLISLGESLFVLPAHLGHLRVPHRRGVFAWLHRRQQGFSHTFARWVRSRYGPFLALTLRHRYLTMAVAAAVLAVSLSYALSGRMGFSLFPTVESDFSQADVVLPYGSPVERTAAVVMRLERAARRVAAEANHPELIRAIISEVGAGGSHTARIRVMLPEPRIRQRIMSTVEFTNRWRRAVGEIPGVEYIRFASDFGGPAGRGRPLTVELSHRDIAVLHKASTRLAEALSSYPGVVDVDDGFQPGKPQLDFTILPGGRSLGLTARAVARQVREAFYGAEALRQQRGREEIKVMVRLPREERSSEEDIYNLMLRTPAGTYVPLREVASFRRTRAYTSINRRQGRRVVQVSADVIPRSKVDVILADLKRTVLPRLLHDYPGLRYSFEGQQADIRESLGSLKVTFSLAVLAIYGMLAVPFRSYIQPFIVMMSIPFGVVGAFLGHLLMGYSLSLMSMFGIVALSGVVVNDSLVMVDFANRRRRAGMKPVEAVQSAAIQRFRPILLTTLTTFGGLAPMIFETSLQARFLIPMALSLGFGILFATFITLVIVPSLYLVVEDLRRMRTTPQETPHLSLSSAAPVRESR